MIRAPRCKPAGSRFESDSHLFLWNILSVICPRCEQCRGQTTLLLTGKYCCRIVDKMIMVKIRIVQVLSIEETITQEIIVTGINRKV